MVALYVHIPFCHKICPYCDFYKQLWDNKKEDSYIKALQKECSYYKQYTPNIEIKSLFLGGGTPSSLPLTSLQKLFHIIYENFNISPNCEITMEMNPESTKHCKNIKQLGVNRVSIGVQSFTDNDLKLLGRLHTKEHLYQAFDAIKSSGIKNWNLDLMFSLSNSSLKTLEDTLEKSIEQQPTHISTYALSIEPRTPFHKQNKKPLSNDKELLQYKVICQSLKKAGYNQYEVSAFSKPGYECQHNLSYWNYNDFIGLGPSAASFFKSYHYSNTRNLHLYQKNPRPKLFRKDPWPKTTKTIQLKNTIMSQLRLRKGIHIPTFNQRFSCNFLSDYDTIISPLIQHKLLAKTRSSLKITTKGLYVLNDILIEFM